MKTKYFFQCLREMVDYRWVALIHNRKELVLVNRVDHMHELETPLLHPLVAVARDVIGFTPQLNSEDEWLAAERLGLSQEAVNYIFVASLHDGSLRPVIDEVRQELVYNLFPDKFKPPMNSLPWDKVIKVA